MTKAGLGFEGLGHMLISEKYRIRLEPVIYDFVSIKLGLEAGTRGIITGSGSSALETHRIKKVGFISPPSQLKGQAQKWELNKCQPKNQERPKFTWAAFAG